MVLRSKENTAEFFFYHGEDASFLVTMVDSSEKMGYRAPSRMPCPSSDRFVVYGVFGETGGPGAACFFVPLWVWFRFTLLVRGSIGLSAILRSLQMLR